MDKLTQQIQKHFDENMQQHKLFRVELSGAEIWKLYLSSFPKEQNPIFRDPTSSSKNCNHCKNFVRRYANIVAIDENNKIITLFDLKKVDEEYATSIKAISKKIKKSKIKDVFFETFNELNSLPYEAVRKSNKLFKLGTSSNNKLYTKEEANAFKYDDGTYIVKPGETKTFHHMSLKLPKKFVDMSSDSVESIQGMFRDAKEVFQRCMDEINLDTFITIRDSLMSGAMFNGVSHLHKLKAIIPLKKKYNELPKTQRDNWCWVNSYGFKYAKFRNSALGTSCVELSQGMDLNTVIDVWNKRVDPAKYMKKQKEVSQRRVEEVDKYIVDNGFAPSFNRKYCTLKEIVVNEILHVNREGDEYQPAKISVLKGFKGTKQPKKSQHAKNQFKGVQEVGIEKFMKEILPTTTSVSVFLENTHESNMVTLTTAKDSKSKSIFKYSTNVSQTFKGNLAGKTEIQKLVESKGGRTDVPVRFSFSWNHTGVNQSLMDLHVFFPGCEYPKVNVHNEYPTQRRIGWNHRTDPLSGGNQDVDNVERPGNTIPVENIVCPDIKKLPDGEYIFRIHNWNARLPNSTGFKAEIALNNEVYEYDYPKQMCNKEWVTVAKAVKKNDKFTIEHHLPASNSSKELYGLETKKFHKVNLVCMSPNHWGDDSIGDPYYLFMLDKCKVDVPIRSYHAVDLIPELAQYRDVLEPLGNTTMLPADKSDQLSGIGFNATVRSSVLLKLEGSHQRVIKVNF